MKKNELIGFTLLNPNGINAAAGKKYEWMIGGYYNGYVAIPKQMFLDKWKWMGDLPDVHGGCTYMTEFEDMQEMISKAVETTGEHNPEQTYVVVGFDTCHCWDTPEDWSSEQVMNEVMKWMEVIKKEIDNETTCEK